MNLEESLPKSEYGKLYVVSTPIGNLDDMTIRGLNILKEVSVIAAEDTRHTAKLTRHFSINTKLISYHEHNELTKSNEIIEILKSGKDVALVSDAGTPLISDPGYVVISAAIEEMITVIPIPGATACMPALVLSGLPCDSFAFFGFLSRQKSKIAKQLENISEHRSTLVFYEAPHRLIDTLQCFLSALGDRRCAVVKEITKKFESVTRGKLSEVIEKINASQIRGEYVIVVAGADDLETIKMPKEHKNKYSEFSKTHQHPNN